MLPFIAIFFFFNSKEANPIFREIAKVLTLPLKVSDIEISQKSRGLVQGSVHGDDMHTPPCALGGQIALLVILNMCKL